MHLNFNPPSSMPPQDPTNLESDRKNYPRNSTGANMDEIPPFHTEQQHRRRSTVEISMIQPSPLQIWRQLQSPVRNHHDSALIRKVIVR
ncbi:unnamed protein product [Vicia faba]|uniref:Uncharacterized protein n=1 Tax=Vicia faba TaxID=3906 RepID=A0AAV0ZSS1_VICFA|nr:unnamed protein product [Vicia faba]